VIVVVGYYPRCNCQRAAQTNSLRYTKTPPQKYSVAVFRVAEPCLLDQPQSTLGGAAILFVERLSQVPEIGIEGDKARRTLEESLSASVVCQTIK
jgi:hypothetical protein